MARKEYWRVAAIIATDKGPRRREYWVSKMRKHGRDNILLTICDKHGDHDGEFVLCKDSDIKFIRLAEMSMLYGWLEVV